MIEGALFLMDESSGAHAGEESIPGMLVVGDDGDGNCDVTNEAIST